MSLRCVDEIARSNNITSVLPKILLALLVSSVQYIFSPSRILEVVDTTAASGARLLTELEASDV